MCSMAAVLLGMCAAEPMASAQNSPPVKGMASTVGLYVYPKNKQSAQQQLTDEQQCYSNAKTQTGFNPDATTTAAKAAKPATPKSDESVKQGAVRGAMIARASGGNPIAGARRGAMIAGMEDKRNQKQQAQQQATATAAKTAQQQSLDNFKKSMSSCLDARGYSVR
jgi:hypothetical protein